MKDVLIYNSLGEQLIRLAQWDRDVYVSIEDTGITTNYPVHFFNKNSDQAYAVESTYSGGKLKAKIPDHLLREPYTICGYVQRNDGDSERRSDFRFIVGVVPKPQPSDYLLRSDPDYIEVETLKAEYKELQKKADTALVEANEATKKANEAAEATAEAIRATEEATVSATNAANRATSATDSANQAASKAGQAADAANELTQQATDALKDAQAIISHETELAFFIDEDDFGLNCRIIKEGY